MNGAAALFLGVDGGGTGCRARLEDSSGVVLGLGQSGPATARLGLSETWDSVREAFAMAIAEARLEPPDLSRIRAAVGIAGIRPQRYPRAICGTRASLCFTALHE